MKKFPLRILTALLVVQLGILWTGNEALALLKTKTEPVTNSFTFRSTTPDIDIVEKLDSGKKVQIKNTGTRAVRVRVYLSVYYQSDTDPTKILPANGFVYDKGDTTHWSWNGNSATWTEVLQPGALTGVLINNVTAPAAPEGYHLEVKVIAQNNPV